MDAESNRQSHAPLNPQLSILNRRSHHLHRTLRQRAEECVPVVLRDLARVEVDDDALMFRCGYFAPGGSSRRRGRSRAPGTTRNATSSLPEMR